MTRTNENGKPYTPWTDGVPMPEMTRKMVNRFVANSGGNTEAAAQWAVRNCKGVGDVRFWRGAIVKAQEAV